MPESNWNISPPPSLGWWPALLHPAGPYILYRWWDGKYWSSPVHKYHTPDSAAKIAKQKMDIFQDIRWQPRPADWPENSLT